MIHEISQAMQSRTSSRLKENGLDHFFKSVLDAIPFELNYLLKAYYSHHGDSHKDDLFSLTERSWIGIFNNAIIRTFPDIATLQEFRVWDGDSERCAGRCDYIAQVPTSNGTFDLIFEAKVHYANGCWFAPGENRFFDNIRSQALGYYQAESAYYKHNAQLVCLVFEWIKNKEDLMKLEAIFKNENVCADDNTDFLCLYKGIEKGVMIYGHVCPAKEQLEFTQANTTLNAPSN